MPRKSRFNDEGKLRPAAIKDWKKKAAQAKEIILGHDGQVNKTRSPIETQWERNYKLYLGEETDAGYLTERRHALDTNIVLQQCETIVGFEMSMLFGAPQFFDITPRTGGDVDTARFRKQVLDYQLDANHFKRKVKVGVRNKTIIGTHVYKIGWTKTRPMTQTIRDKNGKPVIKKNSRVDMLDLHNPLIQDVRFDPFLDSEQFLDADIITERVELTGAEMLSRYDHKYVVPALEALEVDQKDKGGKKTGPYAIYPRREPNIPSPERAGSDKQQITSRPSSHIRHYKLTEAWMLFDLDDDGEAEPCKIMLLEDEHIIDMRQNPYWFNRHPYFKTEFLPVAGVGYARGAPEILEKYAQASRDMFNHVVDNANKIVNNAWITPVNSRITEKDLIWEPDKLFVTHTKVSDLVPVETPNIIRDGVQSLGMMIEMAKQTTGFTDTLMGEALGQRTSATEAANVSRVAQRRAVEYVKDDELIFIRPYLTTAMRMNEQLMDKQMFLRITGKDGAQKAEQYPGSMAGDYDVRVHGVSTMQDMMQARNMLAGFIMTAGRFPQNVSGLRLSALFKKQYEGFGFKDYEDVQAPEAMEVIPMKPEDENMLLLMGEKLSPTQFDNFEEHMAVHQQDLKVMQSEAGKIHVGLHEMLQERLAQNQGPGTGIGNTSPQSQPQNGGLAGALQGGGGGAGSLNEQGAQ
jgi:hypothetical protein